jgi:hypothetical protein
LILGGGVEISKNNVFGASYTIQGKYKQIKQVNIYID